MPVNTLATFTFSVALATLLPAVCLAMPVADTNGDGTIELSEYLAVADTLFASIDADFDGYLEGDDISDLQAAQRTMDSLYRYRRADTDGDGVMSEAELLVTLRTRHSAVMARRSAANARFDLDGNGRMSAEESIMKTDTLVRERMEAKETSKSQAAKTDAEKSVASPPVPHTKPVNTIAGLILPKSRPHHDTDRDQRVSRTEYREGMRKRFATKDANGDGVLDGSEWPELYLFQR